MQRRLIGIATVTVCMAVWAAAASAQTAPAQKGPLVLEPSSDGPILAPEVKFAGFEDGGGNGTLVGAFGGWLFDNRLLLGGGMSFLVDHDYNDRVAGMGYGGFVGGWTVPVGSVLHVGMRALVGFGQAELTDSITYRAPFDPHHDPRRLDITVPAGWPMVQKVRFWDDFFVFEPQATALVKVTRGVAIDVSGGYRAIAGLGRYNSWLRGLSGSVAVRVGPRL
jgi:hypothetical protein